MSDCSRKSKGDSEDQKRRVQRAKIPIEITLGALDRFAQEHNMSTEARIQLFRARKYVRSVVLWVDTVTGEFSVEGIPFDE